MLMPVSLNYEVTSKPSVFLLNVSKKGDRINLSKAEVNALREELAYLAREYREGVSKHVKGR